MPGDLRGNENRRSLVLLAFRGVSTPTFRSERKQCEESFSLLENKAGSDRHDRGVPRTAPGAESDS